MLLRRLFSQATSTQSEQEAPKTQPEAQTQAPKESDEILAQKKLLQEAQTKLASFEKQQKELQDKNAQLQKEQDNYKDQLLRAVAEQSNIISRMKQEQEKIKNFAISSFAKQILDVSDNLQRALTSVDVKVLQDLQSKSEQVSVDQVLKLWEGVDITKKGLHKVFERFQISEYNPMKEKFNPNFHEGIFLMEDPQLEPLTIGHVLQTGWMIKDRVLRPAKVGYVKPKPQEETKKAEKVEGEQENKQS